MWFVGSPDALLLGGDGIAARRASAKRAATAHEASRVRALSARLGLTQSELAKLAGVSQTAIAQFESPDSNPTIDTLNRVARAMGAQIDFHASAAQSIKAYAKQLRRLAPGPERMRVIAAMRDHLSGRTSRQFRALDAALRVRR